MLQCHVRLFGDIVRIAHDFRRHLFQRFRQGIVFLIVFRHRFLLFQGDFSHVIRLVIQDIFQHKPPFTLDDGGRGAVRHFQDFHNRGDRPHLVQVFQFRHLHIGVFLRDAPDEVAAFIGVLNQAQRFVPPDIDGYDDSRKQNRIPQRQYGHCVGYCRIVIRHLLLVPCRDKVGQILA